MADSDSESGAQIHQNQPFDESLEVPDSEEVASVYTPSPRIPPAGNRGRSRGETPPDSRMSNNFEDDVVTGAHDQYHDHDGDDDGDDDDDDDDLGGGGDMARQTMPPQQQQPTQGGGGGGGAMYNDDDDEEDEEESEEGDTDDGEDQIEGVYDPADYEHLAVVPEIKELFQYITRYTPQTIELEHKLKPFISDYIPAVGDIDAFIKVSRPDGKPEQLGLYVLDEPCAKQSDPTVLDLQLRAISKQTTHKAMVVRSLESAEKNAKGIDNWITSISDLHRSKPPPTVHYQKNMPEIDALMQEWPPSFEELLKEVGLPTAELDCDLSQYVDMACALLDIPVHKSRVQSLHVLFTLYSEFKNSQHFRTLAEDNQMDNALKKGGEISGDADALVL